MTRYKGEWRSGIQCEGSDGGGKDKTRGWMEQRSKEGDYEGMKGDGESIAAEKRWRKDVEYQPNYLQRQLRSSTGYII